MKKTLLFFALLLIFSFCVFAEERHEPVHIVSLSLGIFSVEASYERIINRNFSLLGSISYTNLIVVDELTVSGKARWYPFGRTFFMEMGIGLSYGYGFLALANDASETLGYILGGLFTFGLLWAVMDPPEAPDPERSLGFLIQPGMGWNIRLGSQSRFFLPISMGLNFKLARVPDIMPFFRIGVGYSF